MKVTVIKVFCWKIAKIVKSKKITRHDTVALPIPSGQAYRHEYIYVHCTAPQYWWLDF